VNSSLFKGEFERQAAEIAGLRHICRTAEAAHLSIISQALSHQEEGVCLDAIAAVLRLRPADAAVLLETAVSSRLPVVVVRALSALGELGDLALLARLMAELDSEKSFHRIGAARGLTALAVRCPDGNFTPVLEALQKKARLGGVEYRRALEAIRRAIGIDPELPIPAQGGDASPASLPIPGTAAAIGVFETRSTAIPLGEASNENAEIDDDSLARRLNNILPRPED
jgi:hypothetical protein